MPSMILPLHAAMPHVSDGSLGGQRAKPMLLARLRAAAVTVLVLPVALVTHAGEAGDRLDGRGWLDRVAIAASRTSYQGTMVFSAGSYMSTTRVTRYCMGKDSFERHESLDGPPRLIYRHNQLVHTLWPQKKVAVVQHRDARTPFLALSDVGDALAAYDLRLEGSDRVAAHASRVMLLEPRDAHRYAQRLWAEVSTGLMLRADVLDRDGRVLESIAFTDLKTNVKPQPDVVTAAMNRLDGYQVIRPQVSRTKLEDEGWKLGVPVTGFRQVSCVKRPVDGSQSTPTTASIVQSVYSDGVAHVSVFIEPLDAARHKPMMSSWGASNTLARQRGDAWVTVVGDVPMDTLERFAVAVERLR
jgi:sigma-E factor negative regulatory protein RseB